MAAYILIDIFRKRRSGYINITTSKLKEILDKNDKQIEIIDLRSSEEYNKSHIFKARNLYFYNFKFKESLKNLDNRKKYVLYCKRGNTSKTVAFMLRKNGVKTVYNVKGGFCKIRKSSIRLK